MGAILDTLRNKTGFGDTGATSPRINAPRNNGFKPNRNVESQYNTRKNRTNIALREVVVQEPPRNNMVRMNAQLGGKRHKTRSKKRGSRKH
jgi:hypothetical protein